MKNVVYTIGYEGTDIDRFVATLKAVGVRLLVDVRAVALSRKKGFSKTALSARVKDEGIEYVHLIALGDPKPGREAARAGNHDEFRRIYGQHLGGTAARAALCDLRNLAAQRPTCLLCFEREPKICHRSIVADRLRATGMGVFDLYADLPRRYDNFTAELPRRHFGEGASAA
jgi:uncharacterized protein (DUF488 family)